MPFLEQLLAPAPTATPTPERRTFENPDTPLSNPETWLLDWAGGSESVSGVRVNHETALRFSAVWAAIRFRSRQLAQLPLGVFQRTGSDSSVEVRDHPVREFWAVRPSSALTAYTHKQTVQAHIDSWGNGYTRILRQRNEIVGLEVLLPDRTHPVRRGAATWFLYNRDASVIDPEAIPSKDVVHVPGLGWDGTQGYSVIGTHKDSIGYAIAARDAGARWFANGMKPSGLLSVPGRIKDGVAEEIENRIQQQHGRGNLHRPMVVGHGAQWQQIGLPPNDSQFVETQLLTLGDIARIFDVPPHKIGLLKDAGDRANVEQENLRFVTDILLPLVISWEQELNTKMFTSTERAAGLFVKFNLKGLLRGDFKSQMEGFRIGREIGVYNADEIRARLDENPIGGDTGSVYVLPLNFQDAETLTNPPEPAPRPAFGLGEDDTAAARARARGDRRDLEVRAVNLRRKLTQSNARLIEGATVRIVRREVEQIGRQIRRRQAALEQRDAAAVAGFVTWLLGFYEQSVGLISRNMLPLFLSFAEQIAEAAAGEIGGDAVDLEQFVRRYVAGLSQRYTEGHRLQLVQLLEETPTAEIAGALRGRLVEWQDTAPGKVAARESVQAGSSFALTAWATAGVLLKRWITFGPCPLCKPLDGRVVEITKPFVEAGETIEPGGDVAPLVTTMSHGHPPLHRGCECSIGPAS